MPPAMSSTPPSPRAATSERPTRLRESDDAVSATAPVRRELVIYGVALACGLVLMPFLIWFAGKAVLGPYGHGQNPRAGPLALLGDYYVGLFHGSAVFWAVALGPAVLLLLGRLFVALVRALPAGRRGG
jgi:hypothetical protein